VEKKSCDGVCMKMKVKGKRKQCTHSDELTRISVSVCVYCLFAEAYCACVFVSLCQIRISK